MDYLMLWCIRATLASSGLRLLAIPAKLGPELHSLRRIHGQHSHRGAAGRRQTNDVSTLEGEVGFPCGVSGIEQPYDLSGLGIDTGEIRSFVEITAVTRERQIRRVVAATMLAGDYVFDMEAHKRRVTLVKPAIFAALACAGAHALAQRWIHYAVSRGEAAASRRRACACKMEIKSTAWT